MKKHTWGDVLRLVWTGSPFFLWACVGVVLYNLDTALLTLHSGLHALALHADVHIKHHLSQVNAFDISRGGRGIGDFD